MQDGLYHTSATVRTLRERPVDFTARKQGKPGYNPQAERAFLGAVYLQPPDYQELADLWMSKVHKADLDEPKYGRLYDAFKDIRAAGKVPDMVTVNAWLSEHGELKSWREWETDISLACQSATRIAEYARIVIENALTRLQRSIGTRLLQESVAPDEAMYALDNLIDRRRALDLPALTDGDVQVAGRLASEIAVRPYDWIWHARLARRKLTAISGDGGLGKGLFGIYIAARITRGQPLPGDSRHREPANVVMLTPEDEAEDTIVPRLIAAGADLARVRILTTWMDDTGAKHAFTIPRDVERLETIIRHDHAALLLIDPIMGCLDAGVKTGIDSEVRAALNPLKDMAERTDCSIPFVLHLNKDARSSNALYRTGGSIAFNSLARLTVLVAQHPDDEQLRVAGTFKQNIGTKEPPIVFSIHQMEGKDEAHAAIAISNEVCDLTAEELLSPRTTNVSRMRKDVLEAMRQHQQASIIQIAGFVNIDPADEKGMNNLKKLLARMVDAGELEKPQRGLYSTSLTSSSSLSS